jgi:hypothetical protein
VAVTAHPFNKWMQGQVNGGHATDLDTDTIKGMLVTNSYSPNQDTHEFKTDVTNEVSDSTGDYVAGGQALTSKTVALDTSGDFVYLDADDLVWHGSTFTARRLVLYKDTGTGSTSPLIGWVDFGADFSPAAQDFRVAWAAAGSGAIVKLLAA